MCNKKLIFAAICLFAVTQLQAQKDFDYTFYTMKSDLSRSDSAKQTLHLTLPRKIYKDANELKIISLTNTGDAHTFHILYVGYDTKSTSLMYMSQAGEMISINPMEGTATIMDEKNKLKQVYY